MGIFNSLFKKKNSNKVPKGFYEIQVKQINRLTDAAVEVVFDIPADLSTEFKYKPGQYVSIEINIEGKPERRSYSICSAQETDLAIAVKEVEKGRVSQYINQLLKVGDQVLLSKPNGRFVLNGQKNIVGIAAGSGITPIMSIAHAIEQKSGSMNLFFANKTESDILFHSRLANLKSVEKHYYLTREDKGDFYGGRFTKEKMVEIIKADLAILKSEGFFICGPEEMIKSVVSALEMFGVHTDKIHFELFTTTNEPEESKDTQIDFKGDARVKIMLDDEEEEIVVKNGKTILDTALTCGIDAPYSCKGGVCSTCRAKVIKGSVKMKLNYTLTDQEIEEGYILTCQSIPTSDELEISYDD